MKLWLLRAMEEASPWEPTYDCAYGFVVRAHTEEEARLLVGTSDKWGDEGNDAWTDSTASTCEELTNNGEAGIILRDFLAG